MAPPHFKDLGKKAKDILSKKYDFKHEVKTVNKADGGVKLEAGSSFVKGLDTYVKGSYKCSSFGEAEGEIHTAAADKCTFGKVTLNKLAPGTSVAITGTSAAALTVETNYTMDMLAAKAVLNHAGSSTGLAIALTGGMDGYSAGISSSLDLSGGAFALKSLDFGAEGRFGKTHAALKTVKNQSAVQLSVYNSVCSGFALGAAVDYKLKDSSTAITFGVDKALDKATGVKAKAASCGAVSFAVEHKLSAVKIAASTQVDAFNLGAPAKKFGLSFAFGDY